jgi:hypothetical protein
LDRTDNSTTSYEQTLASVAAQVGTKKEAEKYLPSVEHLEPGLKPLRKNTCLDEYTRQAVQTTCDALVRTDNSALAGKVLEFLEIGQILSTKDVESIQKAVGIEDD